ncbi:MAG: aldehyde dehydrogenase family protein [Caulobacterales bacterium]
MTPSEVFLRNGPLIDGHWRTSTSLGAMDHLNPATNAPQAEVHIGGRAEIDDAVAAAKRAAPAWAETPGATRRDILLRWAALIERDAALFARLAALESGVPVMMGGGVSLALSWIRYYAGWADKLDGQAVDPIGASGLNYTRLEPYGVVGLIIPWNSPMVATAMKAAPALAAGNVVVLKPPTITPFVALRLGELALEAGLPAGVFNVVPGDAEAGDALVTHPDVAKISFTGGESVARIVMRACAENLKPLALELGGKSASLVFPDADLAAAATMAAIQGCAVLSGQGCVLPTRVYAHADIYDAFVEHVRGVAQSFTVGDPTAPTTFVGPVISSSAAERILSVIGRAQSDGARLIAGGHRVGGDLAAGNFIAPTVFADVGHDSELARREVFGPVLAICKFSADEEAIAKANDSNYGLGAYLHTRDVSRAHRIAKALKAGAVSINSGVPMAPNTPFGGYKQSGFGREGGRAGVDEFVQLKNVYVPF